MNKIPAWVITLSLACLGFLGTWFQVRADVENLNKKVASYEQVAQDVASIKSTVTGQNQRMDRIENKLDILVSRPSR